MSKSTTTTLCPVWARAAPSAAVDVVLPTPPFPDVMTRTSAIFLTLPVSPVQRCDLERLARKPYLHGHVPPARLDVVGHEVVAADRDELRLEAATEDARAFVAVGAGERSAAQWPVDVDRACRDDLRSRCDRSQNDYVAIRVRDRLARTDGPLDEQRAHRRHGRGGRGGWCSLFGLLGRRRSPRDRCDGFDRTGSSPARQQGGKRFIERGGLGALNTENADRASIELGDQGRDAGSLQRETGEIKDDGLSAEEAG